MALNREKRGKRRSDIGRLRSNMILYEEEHSRGETIRRNKIYEKV